MITPGSSFSPRSRAPVVLVIGAGIAGLVAAWELVNAGHDVLVIEARPRVGGRVETVRESFVEGLYAEAGAQFIPDNHHLARTYAEQFGLTLEPVAIRGREELCHMRGHRVIARSGVRTAWPVPLTAEEHRLGQFGMWQKYVGSGLRTVGDPASPGWSATPGLHALDALSLRQFLLAQGASPGAIEVLRLGYFDLMGDGIDSYSALFLLREIALRRTERSAATITGGNDLLPRAIANRLPNRILLEAEVVRLERDESRVVVVVRRGPDYERYRADFVICTIPFSVLRHLEVTPPFSPDKRRVIAGLRYTSVTRVFFQLGHRPSMQAHLPSSATVDRPPVWIRESKVDALGQRSIVEAYTAGPDARRLSALTPDERNRELLSVVECVYPGTAAALERCAAKSWDSDEWARGAYPWFEPGHMMEMLPYLASPEGRVHFAGEHTSPWAGWMEGAFQSGQRAAHEVIRASESVLVSAPHALR